MQSTPSIDTLLQTALGHHQAGQLDTALAGYQQILAVQPMHAEALHLSGLIAQQSGQVEQARSLIQQAIDIKPSAAMYCNLGNSYLRQDQAEASIQCYQQALALQPDDALTLNSLATAFDRINNKSEAIALYRKAIEVNPVYVEAMINLGSMLHEQGNYQEAEKSFLEALTICPGHLDALYNLGNTLTTLNRYAEAEVCFRQVMASHPERSDCVSNLADLQLKQNKPVEAIALYQQVLQLIPHSADGYYNLAVAYQKNQQPDLAIQAYRTALHYHPNHSKVLGNLGVALEEQQQFEEALECYVQAHTANPEDTGIYHNISLLLLKQGRVQDAITILQDVLKIRPDFQEAHTSLIFAMDLLPGLSVADLQAERKRWGLQHTQHIQPCLSFKNTRDPHKKLRIGYVSGDFRQHSAATVFSAMLFAFNRTSFEVVAYSNSHVEDTYTRKMQSAVTQWRNISTLTDEAAADLIQNDGIDVLVDLSGHSAGNRLLVFARKPAPIQITAWGYIGGTGMKSMDVFFADDVVVPPEEQSLYTEIVVSLPCVTCYYPFEPFPAVNALPALSGQPFTFGSFNRLAKVTDESFALWAQVLLAVPNSRMVLKTPELDDPATQDRVRNMFSQAGVSHDRIILQGKTSWSAHMAAFNQVDVALDPFPHGGGVTTMEGCMMGVPTVTLRWPTLLGRLSAALITPIGLTDWIAETPEQYLDIAVKKAANLLGLASLRSQLRSRMTQSLVGNPQAYAQEVEKVYRRLWQHHHDCNL